MKNVRAGVNCTNTPSVGFKAFSKFVTPFWARRSFLQILPTSDFMHIILTSWLFPSWREPPFVVIAVGWPSHWTIGQYSLRATLLSVQSCSNNWKLGIPLKRHKSHQLMLGLSFVSSISFFSFSGERPYLHLMQPLLTISHCIQHYYNQSQRSNCLPRNSLFSLVCLSPICLSILPFLRTIQKLSQKARLCFFLVFLSNLQCGWEGKQCKK